MQYGRDRCCDVSSEYSIFVFSCILSFATTTFLHLGHFSEELSSGFQQRRSNFLDLLAPLPAPSVSPGSLIQFRRLRSFAKQLLWDRCFQQLPCKLHQSCLCGFAHCHHSAGQSWQIHFSSEGSASATVSSSRMTLHPTPHPNPTCDVAVTVRASSRMTLHPTPHPNPTCDVAVTVRASSRMTLNPTPHPNPTCDVASTVRASSKMEPITKEVKIIQVVFQPVGK